MKKNKLFMPTMAAALLLSLAACNSTSSAAGGKSSAAGGNGNGWQRPENPVATLHFEDADHEAADGWWHGSSSTYGNPIRERDAASDGTCISRFSAGDKETLTFTSNSAGKAELVATMYSSNSATLGDVVEAKFNTAALNLDEAEYEPDEEDENAFVGVSLGMVDIIAGDNKLELSFLDSAPDLDDLKVFSKEALTIAIKASTKETIVPAVETMDAYIDTQNQIVLTKPTSLEGVTFTSSKEDVATVDATGKVTGLKLGTATISITKAGWYSAKVEVVVDKAGLPGEIRVQAEDAAEIPEGFHSYTDRTSGIANGHYGGAYITGYDVTSECSLSYTFTSPSAQTMTLIIAGAPHYQMTEDFVFGVDCTIKLNGATVNCPDTAKIEPTGATMGSATVEVTIGDVNVIQGENTFVIEFTERAPALDAFRFIPKN